MLQLYTVEPQTQRGKPDLDEAMKSWMWEGKNSAGTADADSAL